LKRQEAVAALSGQAVAAAIMVAGARGHLMVVCDAARGKTRLAALAAWRLLGGVWA